MKNISKKSTINVNFGMKSPKIRVKETNSKWNKSNIGEDYRVNGRYGQYLPRLISDLNNREARRFLQLMKPLFRKI